MSWQELALQLQQGNLMASARIQEKFYRPAQDLLDQSVPDQWCTYIYVSLVASGFRVQVSVLMRKADEKS